MHIICKQKISDLEENLEAKQTWNARRQIDELHFPSLKVSCTVKLSSSIMKWLWLEFSSAVLLGTGKLLLNNACFVAVTITGQVWECTLALRLSLQPKGWANFGWSGL